MQNFSTENNTFRKLLGNGLTYAVPRFQRDYSWTETEWNELWEDICETVREGGEPAHYTGYLVLEQKTEKIFHIIDGQQRLTTLSIIVLSALRNLNTLIEDGANPDKDKQRLEQIRQAYIGYLDPVSLTPQAKLSLNRNNNYFFQHSLASLEKKLPARNLKASEHLLRKASDWFEKAIADYIKNEPDETKGQKIATFIETMSDRLFFTVITVNDELNAYKVFETLNARSVRLSSTDLLKNYLFSVIHSGEREEYEPHLKELEDRREKLVSDLGDEDFPNFLRTHWISARGFVRKSELFRKIRAQITTKEQAFKLLRDLGQELKSMKIGL